MREKCFSYIILFFIISVVSDYGQTSIPNTIKALRIYSKIKLDGILIEDAWSRAQKISNFTQRELNEGEPATERTEVAIVYTEKTLYIGVWCYDSEPNKLVAKEMKRDFNFDTEDNFEVIIDTYHDRRNGYLFVINPNGARADVLVTDEGRRMNKDWNGVWDVAVKVNKQGWFAEIEIPFSTLKFPQRNVQIWGINFERNIRRKKEQVLWQGWSRDYELERVSQAGTLVGLEGISSGHLLEIKPYFTGGFEKKPRIKTTYVNKVGADVNYLITSNLKLNLTFNTDFAQVESDRARINLTRFSLYFPEKRDFFLEGRGSFDFGLGRSVQVFYSRRIGIKEHEEIPIIGGVRLIGKEGGTNIGVLSLQTATKEDEPTTNYSVIRISRDVLSQSKVGFIITAKNSRDVSNYVYGIDATYVSSRLFGNKNIAIGGAVAQSQTKGDSNYRNLAYRFFLSYPNDRVEYDLAIVCVQRDFNPEIGFLRRKNYKVIYTELQFNPRPSFLPWIRKMEFKPIDINYYLTDDTNELESVSMEWRPLGFGTKSGEWFEYNIQRFFDRLDEPFEIHEGIEIPKGKYWFNRHEIQFHTFSGRKIYFRSNISWGDYYSGTRKEANLGIRFNVNKHLNISADTQLNKLEFPEGEFTTKEVGARIEYAFNTKLYSVIFGQWNNEDNEILINFRLHWIPKIGSDFYLAINQRIFTGNSRLKFEDTTVLLKLVWRFSY
ncbi:carbohydrate binding family 9 domain-containing protein [Candidatus Aminicenantes bacterium AC-335-B20]|jgi:hypothetical protein|nr:carbohydrate binding family 9 domain-containing protein [SCandidatus Aminicenantes bacterium Aminicenantia_JdfR_composite]MCP2598251.1 carbohydrate binding family 9 domain-containing protein [Candidatus Aminicenantes bacterium AC-335-L06]MCP2598883.1 carbohydrate binding family 9 domain-containing protein [Candidatus Aminicenantes bacterium AC-335-B20]